MPWIEIAVLAVGALVVSLVVMLRRERRARRRLRVLAEIAAASDPAHSLAETFDAICAILVPELADFCMIDLIGEDRIPRRAAVHIGPGGGPRLEQGLSERVPSIPPRLLEGRVPCPRHASTNVFQRTISAASPTMRRMILSSCRASGCARRSPLPCRHGAASPER